MGSALYANVYRFFKTAKGDWAAHKVIDIPSKKVEGWVLPEMPVVLTDILISMDDKYLYLSCWVHGDLRQYDITDIKNPKLTGQIFLGGCITKEFGVKVTEDKELTVSLFKCNLNPIGSDVYFERLRPMGGSFFPQPILP